MKRFLMVLLALCLCTAALYGCGGKEKKEDASSSPSSAVVSRPPATPVPEQKAKAVKIHADGGLNIRAEPSTDSDILDLAEDGSMLPLLVEKPSNGWYQIEYDGDSAYVSAEFAEVVEVTLEEYNRLKTGGLSSEDPASSAVIDDDPAHATSKTASEPKSTSSQPASSRSSNDKEDGE